MEKAPEPQDPEKSQEPKSYLYEMPDPDIKVDNPRSLRPLEELIHANEVWIDGEWCQL